MAYDNFDYGQGVRHPTLRDQAKHICATTGKLCIGQYIPNNGLSRSMFCPEIPLTVNDVYDAAGNITDDINRQCQLHFIAEAIRGIHQCAVESIFATSQSPTSKASTNNSRSGMYPEFPSVERLAPRKTPHFGLCLILENEGTIQGIY